MIRKPVGHVGRTTRNIAGKEGTSGTAVILTDDEEEDVLAVPMESEESCQEERSQPLTM